MAKKKAGKKVAKTAKASKKTSKATASAASTTRQHAAKTRTKRAAKKTAKRSTARGASSSAAAAVDPKKMVYYFGERGAEGDGSMKQLLGGKGANLAEMTSIGLPVPPGVTITTATCDRYVRGGMRLPHGLMNEVHRQLAAVQKETGKVFGDAENPRLVSVRSGAAISMPGMMDTVLNLGLNDESVEGLAQ